MRILFLCHRIPYPPDKGDKIRAFYQIRALAKRHEIDLFTLADDPGDMDRGLPLREYCSRVTVAGLNKRVAKLRSLPNLMTSRALTIPYFYSSKLKRQVRQALAERSYDRIFVYCSAMAQYVEAVEGIPIVTDLVDVDSDKWTQYAKFSRFPFAAVYRREGRTLACYERRICNKSAAVVVTTEREALLARGIAPDARIHVIPNGVDTEFFNPAPVTAGGAPPVIGFIGDMSYFPNQEAVCNFADHVLPLIRQAVPEVAFLIVGRNPNARVKALIRIPGVEVTGFVPDVRTYLARMRISVAPFSIAAGIQNKILEAMAFGLPVVATSRTAQGLSPKTAEAVEIADASGEMASKIVHLLRHPELAHRRGLDGRVCVTTEYNWESSLNRLLHLLENPFSHQKSPTGSLFSIS